jgi:hypothetical protein
MSVAVVALYGLSDHGRRFFFSLHILFHTPRRRLVHRSFAGNRPPHLLDRYVGPLWRTCSEQPGRQSRVLGLSGTARRLIGGSSIKLANPWYDTGGLRRPRWRFVFYCSHRLLTLLWPPEKENTMFTRANSRHGARFCACAAFTRMRTERIGAFLAITKRQLRTSAGRKPRMKMRYRQKATSARRKPITMRKSCGR